MPMGSPILCAEKARSVATKLRIAHAHVRHGLRAVDHHVGTHLVRAQACIMGDVVLNAQGR